MNVTVIHPGTQHAFRLASELNQRSLLAGLHTGFAIGGDGILASVFNSIPRPLQRKIANRRMEALPSSRIHLQPVLEAATVTALDWVRDDQWLLFHRNRIFQHRIPTQILESSDVVIGFDTSSWLLAQRCRELSTPFVLIQTIGHPDSKSLVHLELVERFPAWADTEPPRLRQVREVEQIEHELSTQIIVSSSFTRSTLVENGVSPQKITVLPHGVDCRRFHVARSANPRPFRFIYAGLIDSRKGIPLLLEAWKRLRFNDAELWLVGPASKAAQALIPVLPGLRLLGTVPQTELPGLFNQCDAFVFPSYFEGFGLVILQAMACGLPVITTTATAGPDVLAEGNTGWISKPGDLDTLCRNMEEAYRQPKHTGEMGLAARKRAEEYTWTTYGDRWSEFLPRVVAASRTHSQARADRPLGRTLIAHPGTQYSRHLAQQLARNGLLRTFHTSLGYPSSGAVARVIALLPNHWQRRLANRQIHGVDQKQLLTSPISEIRALLLGRIRGRESVAIRQRNIAFQHSITDDSIKASDIVIGFDTSSQILCHRTHRLGRQFILDQSIAHPRTFQNIIAQVYERYPLWEGRDLSKEAQQIDDEIDEQRSADRIVVPSRFVERTLVENGIVSTKIRLNPFGCDLSLFCPAPPPVAGPTRFIFAGSLQARKGLPLLLEAWRILGNAESLELWIAGSGSVPQSERESLPRNVRWLGRLDQESLARAFQQCHAFVFPSFFEGLAQVQIEAAACGLPVIGTTQSGADAFVIEGETGFTLPAGDLPRLTQAIEFIASNPAETNAMRSKILAIRQQWSWNAYGDRWAAIIDELVESANLRTTSHRP